MVYIKHLSFHPTLVSVIPLFNLLPPSLLLPLPPTQLAVFTFRNAASVFGTCCAAVSHGGTIDVGCKLSLPS